MLDRQEPLTTNDFSVNVSFTQISPNETEGELPEKVAPERAPDSVMLFEDTSIGVFPDVVAVKLIVADFEALPPALARTYINEVPSLLTVALCPAGEKLLFVESSNSKAFEPPKVAIILLNALKPVAPETVND